MEWEGKEKNEDGGEGEDYRWEIRKKDKDVKKGGGGQDRDVKKG